jgi:hypothetical protein
MNTLIASENLIFRCPTWESGWCYASLECDTSDDAGECHRPLECKYRQEITMKLVKGVKHEKQLQWS